MDINELLRTKKYNHVISECKLLLSEAIAENDNDLKITANIYLGIAYTRKKDYSASLKLFNSEFDLITTYGSEFWNGKELIETFSYWNDFEKALNYCSCYIEKNPKDDAGYFELARLYFIKKEYKQALRSIELANKLKPNNSATLYLLGKVSTELHYFSKALSAFEKSFSIGYHQAVYDIIKLVYTRKGDCQFKVCNETCCNKVILNDTNGTPINSKDSFNHLISVDPRNKCWHKSGELNNGQWYFSCSNLLDNNACNAYNNRPQVCKDYPTNILALKPGCTYSFVKNDLFNEITSTELRSTIQGLIKNNKE